MVTFMPCGLKWACQLVTKCINLFTIKAYSSADRVMCSHLRGKSTSIPSSVKSLATSCVSLSAAEQVNHRRPETDVKKKKNWISVNKQVAIKRPIPSTLKPEARVYTWGLKSPSVNVLWDIWWYWFKAGLNFKGYFTEFMQDAVTVMRNATKFKIFYQDWVNQKLWLASFCADIQFAKIWLFSCEKVNQE